MGRSGTDGVGTTPVEEPNKGSRFGTGVQNISTDQTPLPLSLGKTDPKTRVCDKTETVPSRRTEQGHRAKEETQSQEDSPKTQSRTRRLHGL